MSKPGGSAVGAAGAGAKVGANRVMFLLCSYLNFMQGTFRDLSPAGTARPDHGTIRSDAGFAFIFNHAGLYR
jgi:hypothetical protein